MREKFSQNEGVQRVIQESEQRDEILKLKMAIHAQNLLIQELRESLKQRDLIKEVIPISGLLNLRNLQDDPQITSSLKRIVLSHLLSLEEEQPD